MRVLVGINELHAGFRVVARREGESASDTFEVLRAAVDASEYLEARGWRTTLVEVRHLTQDDRVVQEETLPVSTVALLELCDWNAE